MIAELADRQHGVVATWQLREFGFTHNEIRYRAAVGRLRRLVGVVTWIFDDGWPMPQFAAAVWWLITASGP